MILHELKARTRAHHERAEASLPVMDPGLTRARYRDVLVALHAFHAPLEARIAAVPAWTTIDFDLAARWKAPLLARDLAALGAAPDALRVRPPLDALPVVDTLPRALGVLYVLEGATLGGQLVRRHLARTLGIGADDGAAYYGAYGDRVGSMWRAFQALVVEQAARDPRPAVTERIVAAAGETFDALTAWLHARLAPP